MKTSEAVGRKSLFLLIVETDVMISNQYNQFGFSGVSEHPVEAAHVVLPVLQRERATQTQLKKQVSVSRGSLHRQQETFNHISAVCVSFHGCF